MDAQAALKQLCDGWEQLVQRVQAEPLAVPVAAALGSLVLVILLFWSVAKAAAKKERSGTVFEHGVRRSTRQHKAPQQYHPESPAPAKTPRAAKTPKTAKKAAEEKEANTVTPKAATRPRRTAAKTPATAEPATVTRRSARASAKTPAK
ncbi:YSIRK signal domain LPXTG anchor domain surface [Chlorella sorokiniana]|uniref:YSIRK signal domain LPXTG anchor domain surface n=1 Tax=Chlorella sorokiniana TaxID=3076 RepID=A0A2P6TVS6_CHLSO|nr:YSIRK signal domain LPXTG anchor domain surface [Chlorella sorokiniana]|eukprot:PRW58156.1 YSIRK signal domain LPXTG anchor domain surface [Chlorella sorokiniana]